MQVFQLFALGQLLQALDQRIALVAGQEPERLRREACHAELPLDQPAEPVTQLCTPSGAGSYFSSSIHQVPDLFLLSGAQASPGKLLVLC